MRIAPLLIVLLCAYPIVAASNMPATHATALDGSVINFPSDAGVRPLLLMIGFSHKSSTAFDSWNRRFRAAQLARQPVEYYQLVDFQGVPSMVMKMVLHGMKRSVPKEEWSHFAPFDKNEADWQRLTGYRNASDAYLVLADPKGHVIWQTHGSATDQNYSELKAQLSSLISARPN